MSDLFDRIVEDVRAERARQVEQWGKQNHPNGTSMKFKPLADSARHSCQMADASGAVTWMHISREEFFEVLAATDRADLRKELVQLIAVGMAWVENLDEVDAEVVIPA